MEVTQHTCRRCGMVTDVLTRKGFAGNHVPLCSKCKKPLRRPTKLLPVAASGTVRIEPVPNRGLGVVAAQNIKKGTLVERCPVFVVKDTDMYRLTGTHLMPYAKSPAGILLRHLLFPWVKDPHKCIALGYALIYNHEPENRANVRYEPYVDPTSNRRFLDFYALRDIVEGEELCQTYAEPDKLWFQAQPGKPPPEKKDA